MQLESELRDKVSGAVENLGYRVRIRRPPYGKLLIWLCMKHIASGVRCSNFQRFCHCR